MTGLPPRVRFDAEQGALRDYWAARYAQHTQDSYAGVPLSKLPEDLRVYEHLLWQSRAEVVVELGTQYGASALWFRDRLRTMIAYGRIRRMRVVTVDVDQRRARAALTGADPGHAEHIALLEADVRDPALPARVRGLIGERARCLVVEDTAHTYETTSAALAGFAGLVPRGGFLVVEDGCVDREPLRSRPDLPHGVLSALEDWLATRAGRDFRVRRDLERYGLTHHPCGFLQRRSRPAPSAV